MEVALIASLILLPTFVGGLLSVIKVQPVRRVIAYIGTVLLMALTGYAAWQFLGESRGLAVPAPWAGYIGYGMLAIEVLVAAWLFWLSVKAQRWLSAIFVLVQISVIAPLELTHRLPLAEHPLLVDQFAVVMALIIGFVGGLICIYAPAYMQGFHKHHPEFKDRRRTFFGTLFLFLGAMFGLVFSNDLVWLYFFWEITTLCSFLLIGYKQTEESKESAFRALVMNLGGGLGFALAIALLAINGLPLELDRLISVGKSAPVVMAAAGLLAFAGITKSAQFPFAGWLRGAMVAPTPVSAMLHSSTMVKAGVYLVLRLAPVLQGTVVGLLVALVGAVTFVVASLTAICTSDAKKVLAYSTVANLGLIVLCGGIGTYESVWAGILLIIFHAVAKCLLFLSVGVVEHRLHSRDIEDMDGLILKMPKVAVMMQIGIAGMFLAPFGMLISKWAVLKAVVDAQPVLAVFVIFGSSVTLFFWVKWMGKLIEVSRPHQNVEKDIGPGEWTALGSLAALTAATCLLFPVVSHYILEPYIQQLYGVADTSNILGGTNNLIVMLMMLGMVALFPLAFLNHGRKVRVVDPYLAGANVEGEGPVRFTGSAGTVREMGMTNYYMAEFLGEERTFRAGIFATSVLLFAMLFLLLLKAQ
jgi:ech hydrogenase subunit A